MRRCSHLGSGGHSPAPKRTRRASEASPLITVEKPPHCEPVERPIVGLPFKVVTMEAVEPMPQAEKVEAEEPVTSVIPSGLTPVPSDKPEPAFGRRIGRTK